MNQDKKEEITKEFMERGLYYEMRDTLAKHGSPKEAIPDLDGQEAIILEYSRYVPELIKDVVNVVRKHERQRILDELEDAAEKLNENEPSQKAAQTILYGVISFLSEDSKDMLDYIQ